MSAETPEVAPKKSSKKLIIILAAVALLGGGGAGAAWVVLQKKGAADGKHAQVEQKKIAPKPIFLNLEPFTVNLQDSRGERYAQVGVTLQVEDPNVETTLKDRLPTVRNHVLLLISSKRIDDLLTPEGKRQLAEDIRGQVAQAMGIVVRNDTADEEAPANKKKAAAGKVTAEAVENPIKEVLFSQFIVQ